MTALVTRVDLADLPLRDDLRGKAPYGAPMLDVPVRLNVNENPYPPSAALVADLRAALTAAGHGLNRYPDREATALREALAGYLAGSTGAPVRVEQVWAANGSNEVLQQLLQAFGGPGRTALGFEPSYSMHEVISIGTGTGWVAARRADDLSLPLDVAVEAVRRHRPGVVFLCTPNNPTGGVVAPEVVEAVYGETHGVVVVDEAYAELSSAPSAVHLLPGRPRLVVTRTMSKAFAMAGTRLGYLAADPAVVDALRLVRLPYHLSALTQAAAGVALAHADELLATVAALRLDRDRLVAALRCRGFDVPVTESNFALFGHLADPGAVWRGLLERGVLVRDVSGAPGLAGFLRVSVGTPAECDAFLAALAEVTGR